MTLPLEGIRVLDIAQVLAGPYGAAMLGDLGADVIKIEPLRGDESRHLGPGQGNDSAMFVGANRNKRGIALNLAAADGLAVFQRLLQEADIVVDNLRPAARQKLGVDYESLRAVNAGIIAINVSAFGTSGPYAGRPGIDPLAQALGGLMGLTGDRDSPPMKTGSPIVDGTTAHMVVIAALSALRLRERTGEGQQVDVNLLESLLNLQPTMVSQALLLDYVPPRVGCASDVISPYGLFRCKDGRYLQVAGLNDRFFVKICAALECPELVDDERFVTQPLRLENDDAMYAELAQRILGWEAPALMARFVEFDVMAAPVNDMREALRDPQVSHSGMVRDAQHTTLGAVKTATLPIHFATLAPEARPARMAPALGEHGDSLLRELGYSADDIASLVAAGVLGEAQ